MDIDRKVKVEVSFKNKSMRENTCYCGCTITKINKNEFTLDKCNEKECNCTQSKFYKSKTCRKSMQRDNSDFECITTSRSNTNYICFIHNIII